MNQITIFLDSLRQFWMQLMSFAPQLLAAAVILILGWLAAKVLRKGVLKFLKLIKLDIAAEKSGIDDFLVQGGVRYTVVTILANLLYWFIMFTVTLGVLNSLGLQSAAELFNKIILYIPNVFVAVLVLMFGTLFAKFVQGVAFTYLNNIGVGGAKFVSTVAQWSIVVFVVSVALEQLSIGGQILVSAFQIAFGALCLALALAFGLGGREVAAHMLQRIWKKEL